MQHTVWSATLDGVDAIAVRVEVDIAGGLPCFATVGLAEAAVREARARVQAAVTQCGLGFPAGRITVNLAPAHVRKCGTGFDLPMALGLLAADEKIPAPALNDTAAYGELSLSGEIRAVRGTLAVVEAARAVGCRRVLVPTESAHEASHVVGVEVRAASSLAAVIAWTHGDDDAAPRVVPRPREAPPDPGGPDLADVLGHALGRRACEVAAAGGHNLLFVGPPGGGKTMLARRLPSLLPPLAEDEALEVLRIHSVAGLYQGSAASRLTPPFRAPHHTASRAGLIGGGAPIARPGELSLAHRGVLFLDELPEFSRAVLEALRQPLEEGRVSVARAGGTVCLPAAALIVGAMNPCPCGLRGQAAGRCRCSERMLAQYSSRLSGPLLDRFDLRVDVAALDIDVLDAAAPGEDSATVRARVAAARDLQRRRQRALNAQLSADALLAHAALSPRSQKLLSAASRRFGLSTRAVLRTRRVARTLADLAAADDVDDGHLTEALALRSSVWLPG